MGDVGMWAGGGGKGFPASGSSPFPCTLSLYVGSTRSRVRGKVTGACGTEMWC